MMQAIGLFRSPPNPVTTTLSVERNTSGETSLPIMLVPTGKPCFFARLLRCHCRHSEREAVGPEVIWAVWEWKKLQEFGLR